MSLTGIRIYVHGRLRGLTQRGAAQIATAAGAVATRRAPSAGAIVLAHSSARATLADSGELMFGFRPGEKAIFLSECAFRAYVGAARREADGDGDYPADRLAKLSGLTPAQIRGLALYDVLRPQQGFFSYGDLVAARSVARLIGTGASLGKIAAAAVALDRSGPGLSGVRLSQAPWGEILQEIDGRLARLDGQFFLPMEGEELDADEAFAKAEMAEADGRLADARRWYELAARLDRGDGVIPFNLGNVLDGLGRPKDAEIAYRQAIARDPKLADAWFNLGLILEKSGRFEEALASYTSAIAAEPTYVDAQHNAGLILMRLKRFADALPLWDRISAASGGAAGEARRLAQLCRLELNDAAK
jgi:tetratricopeptide (TPR) repeat protein